MVKLIDKSDGLATDPRSAVAVQFRYFFASDADRTFETTFKQADSLQKGLFTRTRWPEQCNNLTRGDRQVRTTQNMDDLLALRKGALQASDGKHITHSAGLGRGLCLRP